MYVCILINLIATGLNYFLRYRGIYLLLGIVNIHIASLMYVINLSLSDDPYITIYLPLCLISPLLLLSLNPRESIFICGLSLLTQGVMSIYILEINPLASIHSILGLCASYPSLIYANYLKTKQADLDRDYKDSLYLKNQELEELKRVRVPYTREFKTGGNQD